MAGPLRVLVVEDDFVERVLFERLLSQPRLPACEVRDADHLAGALEMLRNHHFDIVLLDLGLPDSRGMESIARLQIQAPHVPIIVLRGPDEESTATEALQMGVQDCLVKGQVDGNLLMRAIRYAVERKKAERQLQAAELRYRTIFENSAVAIMMVDREDRLISWNKFTEHLLGMGEEELRGRDVQSLYPEPEWQRICSSGLRRRGMQHHFETKMIRGDGEVIDVDISLSMIQDADGGVSGSIGVVQDITECKRIHEILDRKQKNLEAIFDAAPMGMLLVNGDLRVVRANDAIRQMSGKGYPLLIDHDACEALACMQSMTLTGPRGAPASCDGCSLRDMMHTALTWGHAVRSAEIRPTLGPSAGGPRPWLSVSIEPVNIDGGKHIVVALSDVTDRKRAEEELKETMEMKAQFISTVSHELRTPLTSMKEAVTIVLDELAGKINKDQRRFLDIAQRNIDRLARLIDDVLDFQKLNAGKMKFHMQGHNITTAVEEAYTTMRPHAAKSGVELAMDVETNLPTAVFDSDRIIQALINLLSNAIKFTPAGGRVLVSACRGEEHLVLKVVDAGLGIPKEDLPKIFDRFYRVHRPGKEMKGTGLGLTIVSRIVAAHGGRIEVESELDKGTTFTILLPWTPPNAPTVSSEQTDRSLENTLSK